MTSFLVTYVCNIFNKIRNKIRMIANKSINKDFYIKFELFSYSFILILFNKNILLTNIKK